MRLTLHTDYALRVLMFAGVTGERLCTIQEVSEAYGISRNHLMKVVQGLAQAGYVETVRGRTGGIRLARPPERISVGKVVRDMEEDFAMAECFSATGNRCAITPGCRLKGILGEALEAYLGVLDKHTLAELVAPAPALRRMLGIGEAA